MLRLVKRLFGGRDIGIRLVHRTAPFNFTGIDRIGLVGLPVPGGGCPIPFGDAGAIERVIPFDPARHTLPGGARPDYIHRFTRHDGFFVDFLIKGGVIARLVESTRPYSGSRAEPCAAADPAAGGGSRDEGAERPGR